MLAADPPTGNAENELARVLQDAEQRLQGSYTEQITATAALQMILESPSFMIKAVCGTEKKPAPSKQPEKAQNKGITLEGGEEFLPILTDTVRAMRYALLEKEIT